MITVIESSARLTKRWLIDQEGQPQKQSAGAISSATATIMDAGTPSTLAAIISGLSSHHALTLGAPDFDFTRIVPQYRIGSVPGAIARTNEYFKWQAAPGWLLIDHDPEDGAALARDELLAVLATVAPELANAPMVWAPSSSSEIWNAQTDEQITGLEGQHLFIRVADARDITRAGKALFKRLWLSGHGHFVVGKVGQLLRRGPIDAAVWQPSRLSFDAAPECVWPLESRRSAPVVINDDSAPVDTLKAIPDLSAAESERLAAIQAEQRAAPDLVTLASERRGKWIKEKVEAAPIELRASVRKQCEDALDHSVLSGSFVLRHRRGGDITVADLLAAPEQWHGEEFADPLEPEYKDDQRIAVARLIDGQPRIYSHARGGRVFYLEQSASAPILDAWELQRVELEGSNDVAWGKQLAAVDNTVTAAATAYTVASRLSIRVPVKMDLDDILKFISGYLPADAVHPETLRRIISRVEVAMGHRKRVALEAVTIPPAMLSRHRHETVEHLDALKPEDLRGVVVVWAPLGSGKTQKIGKPFAAWAKQHSTFLAICHRRSLVEALAMHLEADHYQTVLAEAAPSVNALATCLPSITLSAHQQIIERARFVFLDEIAQILRFLSSSSHCRTAEGNNQDVYNRLRTVVANAECVVVADAGCDARTIEFLEECRPGEPFRIIEQQQTDEGITAVVHAGGDASTVVVGEVLEELAVGGRVWLATGSARRAATLEKLFNAYGYRVLAINGQNKGQERQARFLENPDIESRLYDVVVASPVISSGISVEHRSGAHFTLGALIDGGHTTTPADAAQMLRRVRYLRRYTIGLIPNSKVGGQSPESIISAWEQAAKLEGAPSRATSFTALVAGIEADFDNHRADFAAGLWWLLDRQHWALTRGSKMADQDLGANIKTIRDKLDAEHDAALLTAPVLTNAQATIIERRAVISPEELIVLEAHRIRREMGIVRINAEALEVWADGRGIRQLDRYSAFCGQIPKQADADQDLARRRYWTACARAYAYLFAGIDVEHDRITESVARVVIERAIARRHLLAHLGIIPKAYGQWRENKDGDLLPYAMPKRPVQEMGKILDLMGLDWSRREGTATPSSPDLVLEDMAGTGGKPERQRFYQVTAKSLERVGYWAASRNMARDVVVAEVEVEADKVVPNHLEFIVPTIPSAITVNAWAPPQTH